MRFTRTVSCAVLIAASVFFAPGAQAAPTPVSTCGTTAITDVVVTADLACTGDGIVVGADGITVDLGGFVVTGDRGDVDNGVDNTAGHDNVSVVNGVVRNFGFGIRGDTGADKMAVKDVVVSGNAGRGIGIDGTSASVKSVTASGNSFGGIVISGVSASVKSVTASGNSFEGIVIGGASASVKSVTASGNSIHGIVISGASASVKSVTASGNGGDGIDIIGDSASVKSVTASGNGLSGIVINGDSASLKSVTASGNGVGDAIFITGNSASLKSVTASGNDGHGIRVVGDAPVISGNTAHANGFAVNEFDHIGFGVFATGFTTAPTGVNIALGNDNPAECDPATLC